MQQETGLHHISDREVLSFASDNRHPAFVHRMPASPRDQYSVRYFLQCMSPVSVVSSRVLASSTMATPTTLNCIQHSKVTWDRVLTNSRSVPLHCSTGSGSILYCSIQTSQNEAGSKESGSTNFSNRRWLRHQYIRQSKDPGRHPGCHTIV